MSDLPSAVLLDTCAVIWLVDAAPMAELALNVIRHCSRTDGVFVCVTSAWEVGLLSRTGPGRRPAPSFLPDAKTWFARLLALPGIREAPITADIAIESSHLPGSPHGDPADRLIIATARHRGLPIVTRDRKILAYADAGFVRAVAC